MFAILVSAGIYLLLFVVVGFFLYKAGKFKRKGEHRG